MSDLAMTEAMQTAAGARLAAPPARDKRRTRSPGLEITAESRDLKRGPRAAKERIRELADAGNPEGLVVALRGYVDRFADDPGFLGYAADVFWELADLPILDDLDRDRGLSLLAWATLQCAVVPGATDDRQGLEFVSRVETMWPVNQAFEPPVGSYEEFELALVEFGRAGPRSALAAASLLTANSPAAALHVLDGADPGLATTLVRASAHGELGEYDQAAREFDHMATAWAQSPMTLSLDDRFLWARTMAEVGRFCEADDVCHVTLTTLALEAQGVRHGAPSVEGLDPTGHWAHVFKILAARLAHQQGRFDEGWALYRDASDDDTDSPELRRSALRLRLVFADREAAAGILRDLESLALSEKTTAAQMTFVEAALWAAAHWGAESGSRDPDTQYLTGVRLRGQVMARALLTKEADSMTPGEKLRLALMAGDDRSAELMVRDHAPSDGDGWSWRVLAAVVALRSGDDERAAELLDDVLGLRRHDIDIRVLSAQAELFSEHHKAALAGALGCTESMPDHILARVVKAEAEFETALEKRSDGTESAENAQLLIQAVSDYRWAVDVNAATRHHLQTGARSGPVGSEPLPPRLHEETCRRGLHAAILAQEDLDRLSLRGDRALRRDADVLLGHLRRGAHRCCARSTSAVHRLRHLFDQDEAARLSRLLQSHQMYVWRARLQNVGMVVLGAVVSYLGLTDTLPGPSSDTIRATVLALGVLLMLMPFARSLKIGAVELQRPEIERPEFGRSKALRTSSLLQRGYHLGAFVLPAPPEQSRTPVRQSVEAAVERPEVATTGVAAAVVQAEAR